MKQEGKNIGVSAYFSTKGVNYFCWVSHIRTSQVCLSFCLVLLSECVCVYVLVNVYDWQQ